VDLPIRKPQATEIGARTPRASPIPERLLKLRGGQRGDRAHRHTTNARSRDSGYGYANLQAGTRTPQSSDKRWR
jgi:hypothetical protein